MEGKNFAGCLYLFMDFQRGQADKHIVRQAVLENYNYALGVHALMKCITGK